MTDRPISSGAPTFWGVSLCFFLSGVAGLIYQIVWMRYLSTIFGTSELAIVTVLVAYMGGLAVGAWSASKVLHRLPRPVLAYAVLEGAIAASALIVPWLLRAVGGIHRSVWGGQPAPPPDGGVPEALAYLALGVVVLLVPTACMGATLPILSKGVVHRSEQIGRRVGGLYALNTFGAVAGTLLAAFLLIPQIGLWKSSLVGVGLNLVVAVVGWRLAGPRVAPEPESERRSEPSSSRATPNGGAFAYVVLSVMLLSGAFAFAYEILWSRLLSHLLGGSLYAFATMLAAFLAGIAGGGLLGARFSSDSRHAAGRLAVVQLATGVVTAAIFQLLGSDTVLHAGSGASLAAQAALCAAVLMPATLCLGATYPLAVRSLTDTPSQAGTIAGRVYAWNTVGAIVGAVVAGYFALPAFGYAVSFKIAVAGNLLLGTVILFSIRPLPKRTAGCAALLTIACLAAYHPAPPLRLLAMSPASRSNRPPPAAALVYHAVGHSASVAVLQQRGAFQIRTNGMPEAEIFPRGAGSLSYTTIRWMPALPKVLRPQSESILVVGFGGGVVLEALPKGYRTIDVIELEAEVIRANRWLADQRANDPLKDERINIIVNDARGSLGLTQKRYDIIVSQPSHPWTAGASHLYTREFFQLSSEHLNSGGLFVQWLGAHFVDGPLFRSLCATMVDVFPHVHVYFIEDNFLLVGSNSSLDHDYLAPAQEAGLEQLSDYSKIAFIEDVFAVLQLDESGCGALAADSPVITDENNLMATWFTPGGRRESTLNRPERLQELLGDLHHLYRSPARLRDREGFDLRYLASLIKSASPHVDLKRLQSILPREDQFVLQALALIERQPAKVLELLRIASLEQSTSTQVVALEAQARFSLAVRNWAKSGRSLPLDLSEFLQHDEVLRRTFDRLSARRQAVMKARYWLASGQGAKVRVLHDVLGSFSDHRDVWFESAAHARLDSLLGTTTKSDSETARDLQTAAELLDRMLSLPGVQRLPVVAKRIMVAHRRGEAEYLCALGWVLVKNYARATAKEKPVFSNLLGTLIAPYAETTAGGRFRISDPSIAKFYEDAVDSAGPSVFPEAYRQR